MNLCGTSTRTSPTCIILIGIEGGIDSLEPFHTWPGTPVCTAQPYRQSGAKLGRGRHVHTDESDPDAAYSVVGRTQTQPMTGFDAEKLPEVAPTAQFASISGVAC